MKTLHFPLRNCLGSLLLALMITQGIMAQVTMQINLPRVLKANSAHDFEVVVKRNDVSGFTGYEMIVPTSMVVTQKTGTGADYTLTFSGNSARVVSPLLLTNNETRLLLTLQTGARGTYTIEQKLFTENEPANRKYEVQPYIISVLDSVKREYSGGGFTALAPYDARAAASVAGSDITYFKNDGELTQHLMQVKRDSREIGSKGEAELKKASEDYEDANIVLGQAEHVTDDEMREKILKYAAAAKEKAETDMEVAHKILTVSKTLDGSTSGYRSMQPANPSGTVSLAPPDPENIPTITRLTASEGLVYRIQVGAFKKSKPSKRKFADLGDVDIVDENGWYKVLIDSYRSKEEAMKKRETILFKGYEAFVATYQDGVRLL